MFNRAVYVCKLAHDGLYRFLLNKLVDNDVDSLELSSKVSDMQEKVNDFYK